MIARVTTCCYAPPLEGGAVPQCSACWGAVRLPHRVVEPVAETLRALERARALRFPGGLAHGAEVDPAPHRRAVGLLVAAAALLAGAGGADVARRMTRACARSVGILVAPRRRGELDALLEAGELLEGDLRAELVQLQRAAA